MKTTTSSILSLALAGYASAYPSILAHLDSLKEAPAKRQYPGAVPAFDAAAQYVSNQGEYAFVAPGSGDQRGPCPGLNAMANQ